MVNIEQINTTPKQINLSYLVIFRPYQKRLPFASTICIRGRQTNTLTYLECKECAKYLGVLIYYKLLCKNHVDSIALKISKTIGLLSKLRHFVRHRTLDKFTIPLLLLI